MKKIFFILLFIASTVLAFAQEPADALRFAFNPQSGTARQQAVGGAMGSLGGDVSAIFVNPAGLGFYKTGDFVFSPAYNLGNTKSTYFGRASDKQKKNNFVFGTTGFVFGSGNAKNGKGSRGAAFSIAINRTANLSNTVSYLGQNNQSSYSQKYLEELSNNHVIDSTAAFGYPYGTSLAINTFWIDTASGWKNGPRQNRSFVSLATPLLGTGLLQRQQITNRGGITELAIGAAANMNDKFYFGGSLGIAFLDYSRTSTFDEADATNNQNNKFDFATVNEELSTKGVGINLRAGLIFKPVEYVRLGLALTTPTIYTLTDKYSSDITTNTETFQGQYEQTSQSLSGEPKAVFKYNMLTPYKITGSVSYVLREIEDVKKQKGFLTADIEYVNYKSSKFEPQEADLDNQGTVDYLKQLNKAIDNAYKGTFNFRAGGELKFTTLMVRLGAAYYGNPYKNLVGEKGSKFQGSGGLGYRNKGFFVDLTYIHTFGKDIHTPYRLQSGLTPLATIKSNAGNAILTVGFKI